MARAPGGKLKDQHKAFVIQRLACFDSPKEAAEALKEEFGVQITPQGAEAYDPHKRAGSRLAQQWRDLFERTRKGFLDHVENFVPEANKAVRLRHLSHAFRALKARGNHVAAADMLERIAKELGNVHSNRREITGRDGKPIEIADRSPEQVERELARRLTDLGIPLTAVGLDGSAADDGEAVH